MKTKIFLLVFSLWGCAISYPQTKQYVPLIFIEKAHNQSDFSHEAIIIDFGKNPYDKEELQTITNINKSFLTSCFWFKIKGDPKKYFLPVNDQFFDYNYFNSKIYPKIIHDTEVKVVFKIKVYQLQNYYFFVITNIVH